MENQEWNDWRSKLFALVVGIVVMVTPAIAASDVVEVRTSLSDVFKDCNQLLRNDTDAACPRAEKYIFRDGLTLKKALRYLEENGYNPTKSTAAMGASLIQESMENQIENLARAYEYDSDLTEAQASKLANAFGREARKIEAILRKAASRSAVYIDADAYWAPSVNARAMILISLESQSITIILHGDTDG